MTYKIPRNFFLSVSLSLSHTLPLCVSGYLFNCVNIYVYVSLMYIPLRRFVVSRCLYQHTGCPSKYANQIFVPEFYSINTFNVPTNHIIFAITPAIFYQLTTIVLTNNYSQKNVTEKMCSNTRSFLFSLPLSLSQQQ